MCHTTGSTLQDILVSYNEMARDVEVAEVAAGQTLPAMAVVEEGSGRWPMQAVAVRPEGAGRWPIQVAVAVRPQPHDILHNASDGEVASVPPSRWSGCSVDTAIVCSARTLTILHTSNIMTVLHHPPANGGMTGPLLNNGSTRPSPSRALFVATLTSLCIELCSLLSRFGLTIARVRA